MFRRECRAILHTRPVVLDDASNVVLLSQLQHKDVLMFLLAVKSFTTQVGIGRIAVLNDGTLTADDERLLGKHIPAVTLLKVADHRSALCPAGGTWERLLAISALVQDNYVIQLDSDTLTLGPIPEIRDCIEQQSAFVLGTWDDQEPESMQERQGAARRLLGTSDSHVQVVAEASFDKLKDFTSLSYIRGCSGFAGFSRRSFTREFIERISSEMRAAIGEKWSEWGSEQVMSNIVVANAPRSKVLPHPKYADCHKMRIGHTAFVHFIGSCRFTSGTYARLGAEITAGL